MTTTTATTVALSNGERLAVAARWRGHTLCIHAPIRDNAETATRGVWIVSDWVTGLRAGTFRGPLRDAVKLARLWDEAFAVALAESRSLAQWPQRLAWQRQCDGFDPATGPVASTDPNWLAPDPDASTPRTVAESVAVDGRAALSDARAKRRARRTPAVADDGDGGEQFPATLTMTPTVPGRVRYARRLPDGRERLRHPETGKPVRMNGECAAFKNAANPLEPILRVWFRGAWFDVPSTAQLMEWSLDGVAETPDGSRVEPDATDSWLTLLGVI